MQLDKAFGASTTEYMKISAHTDQLSTGQVYIELTLYWNQTAASYLQDPVISGHALPEEGWLKETFLSQ